MKKKIVHLIPSNKIGGVEIAAKSAENYLRDYYDFKLDFVFKYSHKTIFNQILGVLRSCTRLFLKPPDVLITSLWITVLIALPLKLVYGKRITWIHFMHNIIFFHFLDKTLSKIGLYKCDFVFVDSKSTKLFVKKITLKNHYSISFILNKIGTIPKKNEINHNEISFVFIGRVVDQKNLELAIKVIYRLTKEGYPVHFDIYGPIEMNLNKLESLIDNFQISDYISFKGPIQSDNVNSLLNQYDFYLQTSKAEGMAITVVQAMQQGLVCLVTPVGEIGNYSRNMISAVHLNSEEISDFNNFIDNIETCINNPDVYSSISESAFNTFSQKLTYKESLKSAIDKVLKKVS